MLRACELAGRPREASAALVLFRRWLEPGDLERLAARLEAQLLRPRAGPRAGAPAEVHAEGASRPPGPRAPELLDTRGAPVAGGLPRPLRGAADLAPLRAAVRAALPGAELWPLGSAAEGLAGAASDADATVVLLGYGAECRGYAEEREVQSRTLRRLRPALAQAAIRSAYREREVT